MVRYPSIARCLTIQTRGFNSFEGRIYVSPDTPPETRNLLQDLMRRGKTRVRDLWGNFEADPVVIYCHNQTAFDQFGAGSPGVAYLTPLGPYIVIGPHGLRTDIVSHELCHAELFHRMGWLNSELKKPAWFDEGLAMQLDYRYASRGHSRFFGFMIDWERRVADQEKAPDLHRLRDRSAFTSGNLQDTELAYVTAGMEVSRWMEKVGQAGLLHFTDLLDDGQSFEQAYRQIESTYSPQPQWLSKQP